MKINTYVELKTFLGIKKANEDVAENENYWKLIGQKGKIISEEKNQVLVLFKKKIDDFNLISHNPQKNSLWISKSDLELDKSNIYRKKIDKEIRNRSALMSNTKWKCFLELIDSLDTSINAKIKLLMDDYIRTGSISGYSKAIINDKYIEMFGVVEFKEIEWMRIPSEINVERKNREELLTPQIKKQPLEEIVKKLKKGKKISYELENDELTIFGYK